MAVMIHTSVKPAILAKGPNSKFRLFGQEVYRLRMYDERTSCSWQKKLKNSCQAIGTVSGIFIFYERLGIPLKSLHLSIYSVK